MTASTTDDAQLSAIAASSPFDAMAQDYDASFTHSHIGTLMRNAVRHRMDARFHPGDRILELNCGTGEDAIYLAQRGMRLFATDVSDKMASVARGKVAAQCLSDRIEVRRLAIESLEVTDLSDFGGEVDGALSNFGGLNCVADLQDTAIRLAKCVRPGGYALLCVMGPMCVWEWAWYLLKGNPAKAFRRIRPGGVEWRGLTIRYPSIHRLRDAFRPHFRCMRGSAVGTLVPPTYMEAWAIRHSSLVAHLNTLERRWENWPLTANFADHYLMELERISGS